MISFVTEVTCTYSPYHIIIQNMLICNYNTINIPVQWNLCITDTLGPAKSVQIFQVSLHDNVSFGTITRCVDYAGVHIFKCPD